MRINRVTGLLVLFFTISAGSGRGQETYRYADNATHAAVAVDSNGNLFISDPGPNVVRKVSAAGVVTIFAGSGKEGFSGDGGAANLARLNEPTGLAFDGSGNLYIADRWNYRIRKVTPGGIISTVAGDGSPGFTRGQVPIRVEEISLPETIAADSLGNLFICQSSAIRRLSPGGKWTTIAGGREYGFSGDGGPALAAQLSCTGGIAVDTQGNIYFSDGSQRIRKVTRDGIIFTIAGNGIAGFSGDGGKATLAQLQFPRSLVVDTNGDLFIVDGRTRVRRVGTDGIILTIAGNGTAGFRGDGGPAISAQISVTGPAGNVLAVSARGDLYIADVGNHRVRIVKDGVIFTVDPK
jgi:hypothetical protein